MIYIDDTILSVYKNSASEIHEMSLLVIIGHRVRLLRLSISVKVLCVDQVANLGHPGRRDTSTHNEAPVHSAEPFVSFYFFSTVLKKSKKEIKNMG